MQLGDFLRVESCLWLPPLRRQRWYVLNLWEEMIVSFFSILSINLSNLLKLERNVTFQMVLLSSFWYLSIRPWVSLLESLERCGGFSLFWVWDESWALNIVRRSGSINLYWGGHWVDVFVININFDKRTIGQYLVSVMSEPNLIRNLRLIFLFEQTFVRLPAVRLRPFQWMLACWKKFVWGCFVSVCLLNILTQCRVNFRWLSKLNLTPVFWSTPFIAENTRWFTKLLFELSLSLHIG